VGGTWVPYPQSKIARDAITESVAWFRNGRRLQRWRFNGEKNLISGLIAHQFNAKADDRGNATNSANDFGCRDIGSKAT